MKLYNTLTRSLEEFKPLKDKKILFYHCGPTVYWVQHIGNLRAAVWADLIRRSLLCLGYDVTFVRNYTDVGHLTSDADEGVDKMEKGAKREGLTPQEIADKYINIFEHDIKALNILEPNHKPRASQYIEGMIKMIQTLLEKKHAYITSLGVYFDVSTFPNYNKLNRQKLDLNIKGKGKGRAEDPEKRHFADFALWFFKKGSPQNALQTWPSPWEEGFPGWHIECSVMAKELLGNTIDIHMGGVEHIPVHHTNEIAQSESANGVTFVNYWLHNEHLNVDNAKMAKSQGTGFTLKEITDKGFDPLALRYFYLSAHYRSKQNFTWDALAASQSSLQKLREIVLSLKSQISQTSRFTLSSDKLNQLDQYRSQFQERISNDFQVPQALALMWEVTKSNIPSSDKLDLLFQFDQVIGLQLNEVTEEKIPEEVIRIANEREQARKTKDFQKSDELRKKIQELGYEIEDLADTYKLRKR
jgi:cysteinyl-tRNA synthetase